MPFSVSLIKRLEAVEPPLREVLIALLEEVERQREDSITRKEFLEFAKKTEENFQRVWEAIERLTKAQEESERRIGRLEVAVQELVEAQKASEKRISKLEVAVEKLTEAQKKTEIRLNELAEAQKKTEIRLNELAEAQKRTETRLNELAEAQKKTEIRLNELAEAQKKTEIRVNELAEAQKRTEEELRKLIGEHKKTREELGGLSHTVGYILEDRAYIGLPELIKRDFGIEIEEIKRDFIEISPNRYEEINLLGKGKKNGTSIWILGECKTQLKKRDIDLFLKKLSRIEHLFPGEKLLIVVTYQASPQVRQYIEKKGLKLYLSYQLKVLM
ncbi:MAG: chordopoxvirus fusion protein [Candidatus Desulfofervidus auxilii]|nr:chordopoxvirus fusion protein [Candidatus Desulfofervidus auxilii]